MKKSKSGNPTTLTANELTNVKDIKNNLIYTKDNYIISYLKLATINIDLLSKLEKEAKCEVLTAEFKGENKPFSILVIPRTIDMENYISDLNNRYDEELHNVTRRKILSEMIREATEKVLDNNNYEHQFYIQLWEKYDTSNLEYAEKILHERMNDIKNRYESIAVNTTELDNVELIRLCNLFANSSRAMFYSINEAEMYYIPIPNLQHA